MRRMHVLRYLTEFRKVRAVKILQKLFEFELLGVGKREGVLAFFCQNLLLGICLLLLKRVTWRRSNFWSPVGEMTSNIWASLFNPWMESKSSFFSCSSSVMPLDLWMKYLNLLRKVIFSVYWHWLGSSVWAEFLYHPCCWLTVGFGKSFNLCVCFPICKLRIIILPYLTGVLWGFLFCTGLWGCKAVCAKYYYSALIKISVVQTSMIL